MTECLTNRTMTEYLTNRRTNERYPINGCKIDEKPSSRMVYRSAAPNRQLPPVVSLKGYMTSVKQQGQTNSW